jgi:hypothetical protein
VLAGSPSAFGKLIAEETDKWAKVVKFSMSDVVVQAAQSGETPLEYMLRVMRDQTQEDHAPGRVS